MERHFEEKHENFHQEFDPQHFYVNNHLIAVFIIVIVTRTLWQRTKTAAVIW